jgi:hypothetical protein
MIARAPSDHEAHLRHRCNSDVPPVFRSRCASAANETTAKRDTVAARPARVLTGSRLRLISFDVMIIFGTGFDARERPCRPRASINSHVLLS